MDQPLAYHVVVHALEGGSHWTPTSRFASIVARANNGHLPYQRHHSAGLRRASAGSTEAQIERAVVEFLAIDATPCIQVLKNLHDPSVMVAGFNAYNASAKIAVRTSMSISASDGRSPLVSARRDMRVDAVDPIPCRDATMALFHSMLASCSPREPQSRVRQFKSLTHFAEMVGSSGAAVDAAQVFEREGGMPVSDLAKALGCHQRTLERRLKEEGITAEAIRQAARLLRATELLASTASLTEIAIAEGYADLAHMSRSFQTAAGLSPKALRQLLRADDELVQMRRAD